MHRMAYHPEMDENEARSALGFAWDPSAVPELPAHGTRRALWRFTRMLPEYVWHAAVLEGNPFTYPEVQTLLDGITVGGRRLSDERQILSLSESATRLHDLMESGQFTLSKTTSDQLNDLIARYEVLEVGSSMVRGANWRTSASPSANTARIIPRQPNPAGRTCAASTTVVPRSSRARSQACSSRPALISCSARSCSSTSTGTNELPGK
jgi:hypothetical protein